MNKDEALRLALEALEREEYRLRQTGQSQVYSGIGFAITAVEAVLEAKDEPVAWMRTSGTGSSVVTEELLVEMPEMRWNFQKPLYTTPPQRKPLTDEEIKAIEDGIWKPEFFDDTERQANCEFARAIEAAHGIKGKA